MPHFCSDHLKETNVSLMMGDLIVYGSLAEPRTGSRQMGSTITNICTDSVYQVDTPRASKSSNVNILFLFVGVGCRVLLCVPS